MLKMYGRRDRGMDRWMHCKRMKDVSISALKADTRVKKLFPEQQTIAAHSTIWRSIIWVDVQMFIWSDHNHIINIYQYYTVDMLICLPLVHLWCLCIWERYIYIYIYIYTCMYTYNIHIIYQFCKVPLWIYCLIFPATQFPSWISFS